MGLRRGPPKEAPDPDPADAMDVELAGSNAFAVAGREDRDLFQMPRGQGGHYRDGHGAWSRGDPTSLLPGPTVETLELVP